MEAIWQYCIGEGISATRINEGRRESFKMIVVDMAGIDETKRVTLQVCRGRTEQTIYLRAGEEHYQLADDFSVAIATRYDGRRNRARLHYNIGEDYRVRPSRKKM